MRQNPTSPINHSISDDLLVLATNAVVLLMPTCTSTVDLSLVKRAMLTRGEWRSQALSLSIWATRRS